MINNQFTLAGLNSGTYHIEVRGTNSMGQWSDNKAFANITVAYPWFWSPQIRVVYGIFIICALLLAAWMIYLRTQSIHKVHQVLTAELQGKGKNALSLNRTLNLTLELLEQDKILEAKQLLTQSIKSLVTENNERVPDGLYGYTLSLALPYLATYLQDNYHIKLVNELDFEDAELSYELQSDVYRIVFESLMSAILHGKSKLFTLQIQHYKNKLWITIADQEDSFSRFDSKITFNMAMYYIQKIAQKYKASINTFDANEEKGSKLIINIPLETKR